MSEPIILGERDWLERNSTFLLTLFGMVEINFGVNL
jgi:hypothetical protein